MTKHDYNAKLESLRMEMLIRRVIRLLIGLGIVLVILEFLLDRHGKIALEDLPLFPPLFAVFGTVVIVGLGFLIRLLLSRPEDYYRNEDNG